VANIVKVSQTVISQTSATIIITTGAGTGTLTITEASSWFLERSDRDGDCWRPIVYHDGGISRD